MEQIEIFIDENGNTRLNIKGVTGGKCEDLLKEIASEIGGEIKNIVRTGEYYQNDTVKVNNWLKY